MAEAHGTVQRACDDWARQVRPTGGSKLRQVDYYGHPTGGHRAVFWEGYNLYSHGHHYLLAQLVDVGDGLVGLINTKEYGGYIDTRNCCREIKDTPSTQSHRSAASTALRRAGLVYSHVLDLPFDPVADVEGRVQRAKDRVEEARRRRSAALAAHDVQRASGQMFVAREVATLFGLTVPEVSIPDETLQELRGFAVRRFVRAGDPALRDALTEFASCKPSTLKG